jgi:PKD repeat protein
MKTSITFLTAILLATSVVRSQTPSVPVSNYVFEVEQQFTDWPNASEGVNSVFDKDEQTKWLSKHASTWLTFQLNENLILTKYSIQSANDVASRDPRDWELLASSDNINWNSIDKRNGELFSSRLQVKEYTLSTPTSADVRYFRLNILKNNGDAMTQLAGMELFATASTNKVYEGAPRPSFGVDRPYLNIGEIATFYDFSERNPTAFQWTFDGGTPSSSSAARPTVKYASSGKNGVTFKAINSFGDNTIRIKKTDELHDYQVLVKTASPADNDWSTFKYPGIGIVEKNDAGAQGVQIVHSAFPNFKDSIKAIALGVCKSIYRNVQEVPAFDSLTIILEYYEGVAGKSGAPPHITISFSTKYIQEKYKNDGNNAANIAYEMKGVLWHEITHAYQNVPQNAGAYGSGTDFYGFIEGEADYVRIFNGFHKTRTAAPGGTYDDGYTTSAFFLVYIARTYFANDYKKFGYLFNGTAIGLNTTWSMNKALLMLIGKPVDIVWAEYQLSFQTNPTKKPIPDFDSRDELICKNQLISFTNKTYNNPTSYNWTFAGGSPSSGTAIHPSGISFPSAGVYNISLQATNSYGSNTASKSNYIQVLNRDGYLFDLTDYYGQITAETKDTISGEGKEQLVDNNLNSKFLISRKKAWIQWQTLGSFELVAYTLTSGADQPARDPKNWILTGSKDGVEWVTLDSVTNNSFNARLQKKMFFITKPNTSKYTFFRLNMNTDNSSTAFMQLSEWQLMVIDFSNVTVVDDSKSSDNLSVFPNPNNGNFNITMSIKENENYILHIMNMLGEIIYTEQLTPSNNAQEKEINLGHISPGMYLLSVEGERGNYMRKIVVN